MSNMVRKSGVIFCALFLLFQICVREVIAQGVGGGGGGEQKPPTADGKSDWAPASSSEVQQIPPGAEKKVGNVTYALTTYGTWLKIIDGAADDGPGYIARPTCITPLTPQSTMIDPITLEEAESPIKFSWTGPSTWAAKCHDDEGEYNWTHFYIDRILNTNSGTISQNVVHNAYNQQYSGTGSPYYWTAPKHYRYIKAFDSKTSAFAYSSNWSTYTATSDSRTLTADGKLLGSTMAQTNVKGSTATATIDTLGGDSFVVRYVARPFGGKMKVSIDGVEAGIIDQEVDRDKCGWQVEWQWPDELSDGTHSASLVNVNNYDRRVTIDALVLGDNIYDIGWGLTGPVTFGCTWSTCWYPTYYSPTNYPSAYGYSYWYEAGLNYKYPAKFSFTGNKFSLIYNQMPYSTYIAKQEYLHEQFAGTMDVTIDGKTYSVNQMWNPDLKRTGVPQESTYWKFNQEWQSPKLSAGTHTVTFEHIDDRFNKYVNVDGIITTSMAGGITPEGQYKWYIQPQNCKGYGANGKCGNWSADITIDTSATPSATPSAWYQLVGGSAAAKGGDISVTVPDTAGADNNQRVLSGLAGSSDTTSTGFLMTGLGHEVDVPHYLGMTNRDWAVSDSSYFTPPTENFTYLKRLFELPTVPTESFYQREGLEAVLPVEGSTDGWTTGGLTTIKGDTYDDGTTYIYYHTGDLTVENPLTIADGTKRVIFVKGNVTINQNIQVATGSFLSIIATGNLTISGNVTKAQGVYIVDKTITIEDMDPTITGLNRQFEGQGTFVGWQGINLNRDLQDANSTNPAEQFIYRPDFLINAPSLYKRFGIQWREVAPGR